MSTAPLKRNPPLEVHHYIINSETFETIETMSRTPQRVVREEEHRANSHKNSCLERSQYSVMYSLLKQRCVTTRPSAHCVDDIDMANNGLCI